MTTIFAIKPFSGNPADGIDNVNSAVFSRIPSKRLIFFVVAPLYFKERGSIKKIQVRALWKKIRLMWKLQPTYLFGNGQLKDIIFLLCKPRNTKYIIDWHTLLLKNEELWKVRTPWLMRSYIFSRAYMIIAVSDYIASTVKKYFPKKRIVSILNGVDLALFSPAKKNEQYLTQKYGISFEKPLIVFVGVCVPRKRPELFREIARSCPEAQFVAVGRGGDIGSMPREDIAVLFATARAFVFPSVHEPAAAVILEAMASGCVPIVSHSGGNGEFMENGKSGFLIPVGVGEKEKFLEKIYMLLSDKDMHVRMSRGAREEAERHSWETAAKEYEKHLMD